MKWILRGIGAVFILAILAVLGVFIFLSTLNPNDYKDQIYTAVKSATGRDLKINGDIQATLFPVLGFTASGITMNGPDGFKDSTFLDINSIQAGVKIVPLLNSRVEFTTITLDTPKLNVIKLKDGTTNLTFTPLNKDASSTTSQTKRSAPDKTASGPTMSLQFGQIKISNGSLTYTDTSTNQTTKIDPINLTLPGFIPGEETSFDINLTALTNGMTVTITTSGQATVSDNYQNISLAHMSTSLNVKGGALSDQATLLFNNDTAIDLPSSTLESTLSDIQINYLDTRVNGTATIAGPFAAPAITFSASSPHINLDTLSSSKKSIPSSQGTITSKSTAGTSSPLLPVDLLRALNMAGDVKIDRLTTNQLIVQNVTTKISAKSGNIKIAPLNADFYDGKINGNIALNATDTTPQITIKSDLSDINADKIIKTKMGDDYISGVATTNLDLTLSGNTVPALKNSLSGTVKLSFDKGSINKWQLSSLINQAIAIYKTKTIAPPTDDQLYFSGLNGTFIGSNGIFRNDDLTMTGPKMHVFGSGVIHIPNNTIDYTAQVGDGEPDRTAKHIPLRITGPLTAPSYTLDAEKFLTDLVKDKLQKKLEQKLENKLLNKLGPLMGTGAADNTGEASPATPSDPSSPTTPEDVGKQLLRGLLQ